MASWCQALDGNWGEIQVKSEKAMAEKAKAADAPAPTAIDVLQATRDSIHAIMMIRAYRMRGHLHADLDPLKMKADEPAPELDPQTYGFTEADYSRKIFIDNYLGLEYATVPEMLEILQRTYCGTVGIEFMHISDPEAKQWIQERIEGPDKEITFTPEGKKAILNKLIEAEGFEKFLDVKYTGTKRFGLDGSESLIPALEQIIKRGGCAGYQGHRAGHGASRPAERAHPGDGQAAPGAVPRIQGRGLLPRGRRGFGRRQVPSGCFVGPRVRRQQGASQSLTANPSHLEIVDPVVLGKSRAKQDQHVRRSTGASTSRIRARPTARWCCRCCCMAMRRLPARA
jgi:2-oxoglutarate dehydrogenase E1 component